MLRLCLCLWLRGSRNLLCGHLRLDGLRLRLRVWLPHLLRHHLRLVLRSRERGLGCLPLLLHMLHLLHILGLCLLCLCLRLLCLLGLQLLHALWLQHVLHGLGTHPARGHPRHLCVPSMEREGV